MPGSAAIEAERGRLSRLWIGLLIVVLRAVRLRQVAAKTENSLKRRRFGALLKSVNERRGAYMRSLGRARGLVTYIRCMYPRSRSGARIQVHIPDLESPLTLRAGTPDVTVFEQVYIDRLHDIDEPCAPRLIVDAGAHIGCVTAAFAAKFPESTVLALEPDVANYALLCQNVGSYRNVVPIRAAIWYRPAVLLIRNPESKSWTFQMRELSEDESGSTIGLTITELLKWSGMDIDILKLDVEGAEKEIFAAADCDGWLEHVGQIRVELHDRFVPGCEDAVQSAIARDGHRFLRSSSWEYVILRRIPNVPNTAECNIESGV